LVFKDNLPYNDFVAIPISSKIENLKDGEFLLLNDDFEMGEIPKESKLILRKTFVVSKKVVLKKYGTLHKISFATYKSNFCEYFNCI
jgi:mRNA interferase MazF